MIPFALPDITAAEIQAVVHSMENGWLTTGPKARELEVSLEDRLRVQSIAVSSATAGLHLALMAMDIGPCDQVIVPALTFAATIESVVAVGARPVLCDVDPETLCVGVEQIKPMVTEHTRAVIVVHFAGAVHPGHPELVRWCHERDIRVIEDAAHAFGSMLGSLEVGQFLSDATVFSFYATKCVTCGEGGAVASRDQGLLDRMKALRLHGISRDVFDRYTSKTPKWEYDVTVPGWKYNLPDLLAAIGVVQLQRADEMRAKRAGIAKVYQRGLPGVQPYSYPGHAWHLYVLRDLQDRQGFIDRMFALGVGVSVHFKPLYRLTAYLDRDGPSKYPVTEAYWQGCVSLPIYSSMASWQVDKVVESVGYAHA